MTIKVDILDLPSDWLDQHKRVKVARRRDAIRAKHRRKHLRQLRLQRSPGGTYGEKTKDESQS